MHYRNAHYGNARYDFELTNLFKPIKEKYKESGEYTSIGGFWDRKGENEIDIIAVNEPERCVEILLKSSAMPTE